MSVCPRCGTRFSCGMVDGAGQEPCWCTQLPRFAFGELALDGEASAARCFCPDCLRLLKIAAQEQQRNLL